MLQRDVQMSSSRAMAALGPILHVVVRPPPTARKARRQPTGDRVAMLIDTGADCTMIDARTARSLGHEPAFYTLVGGATGRPEQLPVYRMEMVVRMTDDAGIPHDVAWRQEIVGMEPRPNRGMSFGLLGRDWLANLRFIYTGEQGAFSLILDRESID